MGMNETINENEQRTYIVKRIPKEWTIIYQQ